MHHNLMICRFTGNYVKILSGFHFLLYHLADTHIDG